MKNFSSKVLVKMKPTVKDTKSLTLRKAIENFMPIENLSCQMGSFYLLNFSANSQGEALHIVEKIAQELLSNEVIETYEIKNLEEV